MTLYKLFDLSLPAEGIFQTTVFDSRYIPYIKLRIILEKEYRKNQKENPKFSVGK